MRVECHLKVDRDSMLAIASYGITFIRLLIAAVGALTILRGDDLRLVVSSIALVMAFDYFDGATFEKSTFSIIKEWRIKRRLADSISDRLVIQIISIPLLIENSSFVWLYLLIVAREVAISGYLSRQFTKGNLVYPRLIAKVACAMVGLAVISFLSFSFSITFIVSAAMIASSAFALLDYSRRIRSYEASSPISLPNGSLEEIF